MTKEAEKLVAEMTEIIEDLDETRIMEVVGVAQAVSELRSSLSRIEALLDERRFEEASACGYGEISSNFVFLQRTLAGLQAAEHKKQEIVQTVALRGKLSYEEAAPFVESRLKSSVPKKPGQVAADSEHIRRRLREKFGRFQVSDNPPPEGE